MEHKINEENIETNLVFCIDPRKAFAIKSAPRSVFRNPSHNNKIRLFSISVKLWFRVLYKTMTKQTVYGLANQKLCYIQMLPNIKKKKTLENKSKNILKNGWWIRALWPPSKPHLHNLTSHAVEPKSIRERNCSTSLLNSNWTLCPVWAHLMSFSVFNRLTSLETQNVFLLPFPKQACLQYRSFENTVGKGEIARNEQFLLFPQCFLSFWTTFCHFYQLYQCRLQSLSIWEGLKFVVWERVKRPQAEMITPLSVF